MKSILRREKLCFKSLRFPEVEKLKEKAQRGHGQGCDSRVGAVQYKVDCLAGVVLCSFPPGLRGPASKWHSVGAALEPSRMHLK